MNSTMSGDWAAPPFEDRAPVLRLPPHSEQAERAVLGSLMLDAARNWPSVADTLAAGAFFSRRHALIFAAIDRLSDRRTAVDPIIVADELERTGDLAEVGGLAYLGELAETTPPGLNASSYARIVREHADRRELIRIASAAATRAYEGDDSAEIVTDAESAFLTLSEHRGEQGPHSVADILRGGYVDTLQARAEGKARGVSTGFPDIDRITAGLRPGQLIVIAARPGEGKTTLAGNIAEHVAVRLNEPVLFFSLEMLAQELTDRFASSLSGAPLSAILAGDVSDPRFLPAVEHLQAAPLHIDDSAALHVAQIRARAMRAKRRHGLALLIVDYLQLVRAKAERRHEEVATVSRSLKALAKELACPVLALAQLNRASEARNDKRPTLADLRESGQIEQDADVVALIYRDQKLLEGLSVVEIAKQRSGPTGRVILAAQLDCVRFRSHAGPVEAIARPGKTWEPYA